jgi:hypothetical protein
MQRLLRSRVPVQARVAVHKVGALRAQHGHIGAERHVAGQRHHHLYQRARQGLVMLTTTMSAVQVAARAIVACDVDYNYVRRSGSCNVRYTAFLHCLGNHEPGFHQ